MKLDCFAVIFTGKMSFPSFLLYSIMQLLVNLTGAEWPGKLRIKLDLKSWLKIDIFICFSFLICHFFSLHHSHTLGVDFMSKRV